MKPARGSELELPPRAPLRGEAKLASALARFGVSVADPYRLDQGDVSFDCPDSVKTAMARAIAENKTHYLQTSGVSRLREVTPTEVVVAACEMIRVVDLNPFDLSMWYRRAR